jgi:hypothetical protein
MQSFSAKHESENGFVRAVRGFRVVRVAPSLIGGLIAHVTHARGFLSAYYTFRFAPRVAITDSACYARRLGVSEVKSLGSEKSRK